MEEDRDRVNMLIQTLGKVIECSGAGDKTAMLTLTAMCVQLAKGVGYEEKQFLEVMKETWEVLK